MLVACPLGAGDGAIIAAGGVELNLRYLGDALDHWKGSLFEFLIGERLLQDFVVDPMATDGECWTATDISLFARLLRVRQAQILRHKAALAARSAYFAEIQHAGDLFLDPDTGIDTRSGTPIDKYVKASELTVLLNSPPTRVVAVYQHVRAQRTCDRVDACLQTLRYGHGRIGWCSYESGNVAMIFLSRNIERTTAISDGFGRLLGRHKEGRVRCG